MSEKRFYLTASAVYAAGYIWTALSYMSGTGALLRCPLRALTGWPCPFCDLTHAFHCLLEGNVMQALSANPLAVFAPVALLFPLVVYDWLGGRRRLWTHFQMHRRLAVATAVNILAAVWVYKILTAI